MVLGPLPKQKDLGCRAEIRQCRFPFGHSVVDERLDLHLGVYSFSEQTPGERESLQILSGN